MKIKVKVDKCAVLLVVLVIFVAPAFAHAAWWNPFTWKIFNRIPTEKVQETKQPSEIEKLRSEIEELKKKTATPAPSAVKPSAVVGDKSKATPKSVTPVAKPVVTATELKKQDPQEYKTLVDENKAKLLEASKLLSNKNIIARVKPSVVYIETASGSGSGIIVSTDGYILTNAHVISGTNSATVKLTDGGSYSGAVVGRDENIDIALIKINGNGLSAAFLGDSDLVEQGDSVFTFGYPLGIEGDVAFKDGTISRRQKINGTAYLEISAQILPGNSGGPLVNQAGEVVGINTLAVGALKVGGVLIGETLKFALPINVAKSLIPDLKNGRNVVTPKAPVITQEPAPTLPPQQPYVPPQIFIPPPEVSKPTPTPVTPSPAPIQPAPSPTPVAPPIPTFTSSVCSNPNDINLRTVMENNDLSTIQSIIKLCSGKLSNLANLLPLAAYYNQNNIVLYLLDNNFDPNYSGFVNGSLLPGTVNGLTSLHISSQKRNLPLVQALLNKGASVNTKGYGGFTALHFSVGYPDYIPELPRLLISKGADVNVADNDGRTALTGAAGDPRSTDATQLLLENEANVNAKTNNGTTALLQAVWNGAIENVKLLISKGADVSAKNDNGDTPLSYAVQRSYPDIATLLKQAGAIE